MGDGSWKAIEQIRPDDTVMSPQPDGSVMRAEVTTTWSQDDHDTCVITTVGRGGERSFCCSIDQRLPFRALNRPRCKGSRKRETQLVELTVRAFMNRGALFRQKARVFTAPAYDLPEVTLPVHPYVLAALIGNGGMSRLERDAEEGNPNGSLNVAIADGPVITKLREFGVVFTAETWRGGCWHNSINNTLRSRVRTTGLAGHTSYDKFVPEEYMQASLEQRLWMLAGLIDTDGTKEEFATVSKLLADDFVALIHSIGGVACARHRYTSAEPRGKKFPSWRVHYSTGEHAIPVQCSRKYQGPRNMAWKNPRNTSFEIRSHSRMKIYGFSVASPSRWHVTDDWLVTSCGLAPIRSRSRPRCGQSPLEEQLAMTCPVLSTGATRCNGTTP